MKKLIALIMCSILMLTGCKNDKASNKNVSSKETSQNNIEKVFDVDKKGLESKGYENLADIAYGRITEIEGKITVFLAYYQNEPEISFYLLAKIMQLLDNNVNFLITWDSKDYDINEEKMNKVGKDSFESIFPNDWHDIIKKSLSDGSSIEDFVSKSSADMIDKVAEKFVSKYLEDNQAEIISQQEYNTNSGKFSMKIEKHEEKLSLDIQGIESTEEKAYLMFSAFLIEFNNIGDEFSDCSCTIRYNDIYVLYQRVNENVSIISGLNKDGSFTMDMPDWVDKNISDLNMAEDEVNKYLLDLETYIKNFGKLSGYKMGYLLQ